MLYNNNLVPFNIFKSYKDKAKQLAREEDYFYMILNGVCSMFNYEFDTDTYDIDSRQIEQILCTNGLIGFTKYKGKVVCGVASFNGKLLNNGKSDRIMLNLASGMSLNRKLEDVVIGYNNLLGSPDTIIGRLALQFAQTDLSQVVNIKRARLTNIYSAKDDKTKTQIEEFLDRNDSGRPLVIRDNNISIDGTDNIKTYTLNDINAIDKITYLSQYHQDLLRRLFTHFGCALGEGFKQAQQSVEEVSSNNQASMVVPLMKYKERLKLAEELSEKFGEFKVTMNEILTSTPKDEEELEEINLNNEDKLTVREESVNNENEDN